MGGHPEKPNEQQGEVCSSRSWVNICWDPQIQVHGEAGLYMFDQIDKIIRVQMWLHLAAVRTKDCSLALVARNG